MRRRTLAFSCLVATIIAGAVALAIAAQRGGPLRSAAAHAASSADGAALPVLWRVPAFSFVDQRARPTTAADLRGHVWIADFIFTRCTTLCPLITAKMAELQRRLPGRELHFVSFSVDPEHDTPEVLEHYAAAWRPGEARWLLLQTTAPALKGFASGMYVGIAPADNDITHSSLFFLVDATGGVRGIYESEKHEALDALVRDAAALSGTTPVAAPADTAKHAGPEANAAATTPASSTTVTSAIDPVCSMKVEVVKSTPHAVHAGRSYHFCSEMCRDKFVANPTRYVPH